MQRLLTAFTCAGSAPIAGAELIDQLEAALVRGGSVGRPAAPGAAEAPEPGGGLLLATAAAGGQGARIGALLGERWPAAAWVGTSFEGLLAEGRVWQGEPGFVLLAWASDEAEATAPREPIPFVLPRESLQASSRGDPLAVADQLARELGEAIPDAEPGPEDLVLLFPDALESGDVGAWIAQTAARAGGVAIAGAAASGIEGGPSLCWSWLDGAETRTADGTGGVEPEPHPGGLSGLFVPGGAAGDELGGLRLQVAGGSRFASPWLEISASRDRWVDGLDGERALDWVRRQLALDDEEPVEPFLDRLLVRLRRRVPGEAADALGEAARARPCEPVQGAMTGYSERYVVGIDRRRGALSLPACPRRGDYLALALPDAAHARESLRAAFSALPEAPLVMQFACRARDEALHGDRDLESALVEGLTRRGDGTTFGTLAPFQLGPGAAGETDVLVHASVLAALGEKEAS